MDYEVYFCLKRMEGSEVPTNSIQVYPTKSTWNDFGHHSQFFFLVPGEEAAREFRFSFLLKNTDIPETTSAAEVIEKTLAVSGDAVLPAKELPRFFSMFYEIEDYRNLVMMFGVEKANSILSALNDIVYVRHNKLNPEWLHEAMGSRIFNLSFLRNSEGLFAFYNAGSVLAGVKYENLEVVAENISLQFQLLGFKNEHRFKFDFDLDSIVPKKIAVIIGKNGVGKSRALYHIADAILNARENISDVAGNRPTLNKLIAISTPGETYGTFPVAPKDPRIKYERLLSERVGIAEIPGRTLPEIFIQLAKIWDNQIGEQRRWDIFEELIADFLPLAELAIAPPADSESDEYAVIRIERLIRGGEQKTLEAMRVMHKDGVLVRKNTDGSFPLSSGQVSFIRLAAQLSLTVENASLILIDEPETHLHPNLITDFVGMLNKVLDLTGSISIMASHSAYLVREVPRSQVHVIQEIEKTVEVSTPRLKTFGADVGAISEFVFGDEIVNRLVREVERGIQRNPFLRYTWKEEFKAELSTEAIMYLTDVLEGKFVGDDSKL